MFKPLPPTFIVSSAYNPIDQIITWLGDRKQSSYFHTLSRLSFSKSVFLTILTL